MLYFDGIGGLAVLAIWIFCLIEAITTDEALVRNLPKMAWVLIVLFFFDIGAIAWLIAGRPRHRAAQYSMPYKGNTGIPPEYDRPGRATAHNPDDDAAFLAQLRERAESQRRAAAEEAKRRREQGDQPPQQ